MNLISNLAKLAGGQMHFGLSKNNISLVLCFSSLLPSPPATNCHRYSFSFGANNTILFKIQPSSNAKLLRAAYTRATRQRQSNGVNSIYVLHCCHLAWWWICHLLIPARVIFISDRLGEGESRAMRGGGGRLSVLISSLSPLQL